MSNDKLFSIGEFSKKTGIPIRTLRYYDEIGILVPEKDSSSGHRIYKYEDIITLQKIMSLKFLGYSLDKITSLLKQTSFTVDLNDTLTLHMRALEEEKAKIDKSINAINRVVHILREEGEVESNLLFSLINGLPIEHIQKEWLGQNMLSDVVEGLDKKSEEEKMILDKVFVRMSKKVKDLYGKPVEDPEVKQLVEEYLEATFSFLGEDLIQKLAEVNVEEQDIQEFENMLPSPFTDVEQKWLLEAMEYYMGHAEMGDEI